MSLSYSNDFYFKIKKGDNFSSPIFAEKIVNQYIKHTFKDKKIIQMRVVLKNSITYEVENKYSVDEYNYIIYVKDSLNNIIKKDIIVAIKYNKSELIVKIYNLEIENSFRF